MKSVIQYPLSTEKSIRLMDSENTLAFVVSPKSTRKDVKSSIEQLFSVKVESVRIYNNLDGRKRAYVKFSKESPAIDVATKMGIM